MSSAILYLAIVAIWACVLIPRWLRHDSARGSSPAADQASPGYLAPPDASAEQAPVSAEDRGEEESREEDVAADPPQREQVPPPLTPAESRRRMLSARRRLLGMLIALEAAAISLTVVSLAAMWVVIPPSLMLAGYLLILREASHADAERAAMEAEAAARARARARERARARQQAAGHGAAVPPGVAEWTAPVAQPAAATHYEDLGTGRDFAPGLAGKYTTSNAEIIDISARAAEDFTHEPPEQELRAVGD